MGPVCKYRELSVPPGIDPGYTHLPQSKIIMYSFMSVLLSSEKKLKISSSAPGLSKMTLRKCRIDRPFPDHVIRANLASKVPKAVIRCRNVML